MRLFTILSAVLIATPGLVSAQSVLERVLGQIDNSTNLAQVNGTYANIAETLPSETFVPETTTTELMTVENANVPVWVATVHDTTLGVQFDIYLTDLGSTMSAADTGLDNDLIVGADGTLSLSGLVLNNFSLAYENRTMAWDGSPQDVVAADAVITSYFSNVLLASASNPEYVMWGEPVYLTITNPAYTVYETTVIDGSITNVIAGVTSATQEAIASADTTATEWGTPTFDLGDMSTTALGAVDTGEITLGVNSAVDEAATSTTSAISAVMTQIGGSADTGALVLNVAHNASAVNGSIQNTISAVNGSIGALSTTALGAVNTGTITSGVDAAIQGIVGMSGQSGL